MSAIAYLSEFLEGKRAAVVDGRFYREDSFDDLMIEPDPKYDPGYRRFPYTMVDFALDVAYTKPSREMPEHALPVEFSSYATPKGSSINRFLQYTNTGKFGTLDSKIVTRATTSNGRDWEITFANYPEDSIVISTRDPIYRFGSRSFVTDGWVDVVGPAGPHSYTVRPNSRRSRL